MLLDRLINQLVTAFTSEIARIVRAKGKDNGQEVLDKAQAGWAGRVEAERILHSWLGPFTDLLASTQYDDLRQDVNIEKSANILTTVPESKDPGSQAAYNSFTNGAKGLCSSETWRLGRQWPKDYGSLGHGCRLRRRASGNIPESLRIKVTNLLIRKRRQRPDWIHNQYFESHRKSLYTI